MTRLVMESAGLTWWPLASLVVFGVFALLMVAWLYRKGSGGFYEGMARLALDSAQDGEDGRAEGRHDGRQG